MFEFCFYFFFLMLLTSYILFFITESMITPEQILTLLKSRKVKCVERLLEDPRLLLDNRDLLYACRNYIMFCILVANGQRVGAIQAITPAAIDRARLTADGAVVTVSSTFISSIEYNHVK